jgi:hypothetical protein
MCKACDLVKGLIIIECYSACNTLDGSHQAFSDELNSDFPSLKRTGGNVFCSTCRSFSIKRGGPFDIRERRKMKKCKLVAEEGLCASHIVKQPLIFINGLYVWNHKTVS